MKISRSPSLVRIVLVIAMGFSVATSGVALGAPASGADKVSNCAFLLDANGWMVGLGSAAGEPVVAGPTTLAQAERSAVDLQQGMGSEDVLRLLGSPQRTSLRSEGADLQRPSRGTLQWTYTWKDSAQHATLTVEFASKGTEVWAVKGWEWINY